MYRLAATALAAALLGGCSRTSPLVDAAIDSVADPCRACTADQICVAGYDGTCRGQVGCVARTVDCPNNVCSAACESAYCHAPYQCQDRPPCGGEPPGAFTCYGP